MIPYMVSKLTPNNLFHQGVGQISAREGLFSCRLFPKRGQICYIPPPLPQSLNGSAELPPILDITCISDIATDMADLMLSIAIELAPHSKRPRGAQGWCAGPGMEAGINEAWQQREEARTHLRAEPHNINFRKAVKMAGKSLRKVSKAALLSFFWDFVRKLETHSQEGDQAGFHKHFKTMNLEEK